MNGDHEPAGTPRPTGVEQDYDEFGLFGENAAEVGLQLAGPVTVRRDTVPLDGDRQLSALLWGTAEPQLLLLHGGGQNAHTWDTVLLALRRPALAVDLPGHGHSGAPDPADAVVDGYARDVARALKQLAPNCQTVVGMSAGGLTAIRLATRYAPQLRRVMLVDVLPEPDPTAAQMITDFLDGPEFFDSFAEILERTLRYNPSRSESSLRRGILHNAVRLPDGRWQWRHRRHRRSITALDQAGRTELAEALWADLAALDGPLCLVRGQAPGSVVTDAQVERLRSAAPRATVVDVPGAGHSIQGDQPLQLAELISGFLDPAVEPPRGQGVSW